MPRDQDMAAIMAKRRAEEKAKQAALKRGQALDKFYKVGAYAPPQQAATRKAAQYRRKQRHTVKRGETIHDIGDKYGLDEKGILEANVGVRTLRPGQELTLPEAPGPVDARTPQERRVAGEQQARMEDALGKKRAEVLALEPGFTPVDPGFGLGVGPIAGVPMEDARFPAAERGLQAVEGAVGGPVANFGKWLAGIFTQGGGALGAAVTGKPREPMFDFESISRFELPGMQGPAAGPEDLAPGVGGFLDPNLPLGGTPEQQFQLQDMAPSQYTQMITEGIQEGYNWNMRWMDNWALGYGEIGDRPDFLTAEFVESQPGLAARLLDGEFGYVLGTDGVWRKKEEVAAVGGGYYGGRGGGGSGGYGGGGGGGGYVEDKNTFAGGRANVETGGRQRRDTRGVTLGGVSTPHWRI